MTFDNLPKGSNPGQVRALRRQAAALRKRADSLQSDLDLTVQVFAKSFEQHDHKESVEERISRTARSRRSRS